MVNENMNVENGQCMPRLCECVLKMVNENAVVKLLMKMPRITLNSASSGLQVGFREEKT
jgi:hypothetical protein